MRIVPWTLLLVTVTGAAACESTISAPEIGSVVVISGDNQTVAPGATSAQPIVVEVRNRGGGGIRNSPVLWAMVRVSGDSTIPSGRIVQAHAQTDGRGRAEAWVRVDTVPGTYRVLAFAGQARDSAGVARSIDTFATLHVPAPAAWRGNRVERPWRPTRLVLLSGRSDRAVAGSRE